MESKIDIEAITQAFLEITKPEITYFLDRFLDEESGKEKEYHTLRLVLPYHPKVVGTCFVSKELLEATEYPFIAKFLKDGVNEKFEEAQELEKLSKRHLIRFICWLFHY